MKNKFAVFLLALSLVMAGVATMNSASAYCWRGYYGRLHCNGYGYGGGYYRGGYGYHHCRTWVGPYGGWHRQCW